MRDMSIHAGVPCAKCSRVLFTATLKRIPEVTKAVYQITCPPPCSTVTYFRIEEMKTSLCPTACTSAATQTLASIGTCSRAVHKSAHEVAQAVIDWNDARPFGLRNYP